jgi:hypothetical protein
MKLTYTNRGFARYEFKDFNGENCSLQKSSIVGTLDCDFVEAIWLGLGDARMHLTRQQVGNILPVLIRFADSGSIEPTKPQSAD